MNLSAHVNFGGNCAEAFRYYEQHLGGRIVTMMQVRDLPPGTPAPHESADKVIHVRMQLGGIELVGNDVPAQGFQPPRSVYLYLVVDSAADAERIFGALADGGQVSMPMAETFFATRFAQLRDRFGVLWTILHPKAS